MKPAKFQFRHPRELSDLSGIIKEFAPASVEIGDVAVLVQMEDELKVVGIRGAPASPMIQAYRAVASQFFARGRVNVVVGPESEGFDRWGPLTWDEFVILVKNTFDDLTE